jgi:hypothetical protein
MRTPRPQDFTPTTHKKIRPEDVDVSDITPLKSKHRASPKKTSNEQKSEPSVGDVRPLREERSVRTPQKITRLEQNQLSKKREIKRHAFEIYKDQLAALQQLKVATMMKGELKSMSAMVREALDEFINKTS